jgi:hypothetical protein
VSVTRTLRGSERCCDPCRSRELGYPVNQRCRPTVPHRGGISDVDRTAFACRGRTLVYSLLRTVAVLMAIAVVCLPGVAECEGGRGTFQAADHGRHRDGHDANRQHRGDVPRSSSPHHFSIAPVYSVLSHSPCRG